MALAAAALAAAMPAAPAAAEIYKWVDEKGVVNFTSDRPESDPRGLEVMEEDYSGSREPGAGGDATSIGSSPGPSPEVSPAKRKRPPAIRAGAPAAAPGAGAEVRVKSPSPPVVMIGDPSPTESFKRRR